jgi:hypothetical protein
MKWSGASIGARTTLFIQKRQGGKNPGAKKI